MLQYRGVSWSPTKHGVAAVLAIALLVRLAFLFPALGNEDRFADAGSDQYVTLAKDLPGGYWESDSENFELGLSRTPAYPAFLSLFFAIQWQPLVLAALAQILLTVGGIVLTYRLADGLLGSATALGSALLLAVDPISVMYASYPQPETVFAVLLIGGGLLWHRALQVGSPWTAFWAGLLLGLSVLTRPIGLYLPVVLLPASWALASGTNLRRARLCLVLLAAFALPVGGWIARNQAVTGVPILSTIEGRNFLDYRAAGALAEELGTSRRQAKRILDLELEERLQGTSLAPAQLSKAKTALGIEVLLTHPLGAIESTVKGMVRTLLGPGRGPLLVRLGSPDLALRQPAHVLLLVLATAVLGVTYLAVGVGTWSLLRLRNFATLGFLGLFLGYFLVISAGAEAYSRFRIPMMPFLAVLGGHGLAVASMRLRANGAKRFGVAPRE